jgi:hypothetical protein
MIGLTVSAPHSIRSGSIKRSRASVSVQRQRVV